jgi:hypothetical protein
MDVGTGLTVCRKTKNTTVRPVPKSNRKTKNTSQNSSNINEKQQNTILSGQF